MKREAEKLLEKAARAIDASRMLLASGAPEFAAGRAYYAMFYTAEALLAARGLRFGKHSGVHAAFGEHFAKTEILDPTFHRWLLDAFDKRIAGDYGVDVRFEEAEVREMQERAQTFLQAARLYLEGNG